MENGGKLSYVKKVIRSLVVSTPDRMTVERLRRDYMSEEGGNVPYASLGFRDIESFLRAIPDTVTLVGSGPMASVLAVATENSAHIQNLVQRQKKPSRNRGRAKLKPRFCYGSEQSELIFINERIAQMKQREQQQVQELKQLQQQLHQQQRRYQRPVHSMPVSYPNYSRLQGIPLQMPPHRPAPVVYPNINALISARQPQPQPQVLIVNPPLLWFNPYPMMLTPFPYPYPQTVPILPQIIPMLQNQNLTRPRVQNIPNPRPQASLPKKQEIEITELVDSMKNMSTADTALPTGFIDPLDKEINVSDCEDWTEDDLSSKDGKPSKSSSKNDMPVLDKAVELKLEPVSQPEPFSKSAIPENTGQSRRHNNPFLEFSDEEEPDRQPELQSRLPQGGKNPFLDYESSDDGSDENAIPAYALDDRILSVDYPADCVRSDFKLPVRDISATFNIGDRIEVQLVRVKHPHNFDFWIYNEEYDDYKAMYLKMQGCYESQLPNKYLMPWILINPDHMCVVRTSKNDAWERAQVRHQPDNTSKMVEVRLVDTGEVMCVGHKDVKYMLKEFATMPAQCVSGRLAFVAPWKGPGWSDDAVKYFFRLVLYRRLYAKIEGIKDDSAYLVLVDPDTTTFNKNLNKALIDSGYVRRCFSP